MAITVERIDAWHDDLARDKTYTLSKTIMSRTNMKVVLQDREAKIQDQMIFNVQIPTEGEPVTNQLSSGRCWLFAMCNVVRIFIARKYNLGEFQLSQSYLFYWDHLAKANWFLERCIAHYEEPLDSRLMQFLQKDIPAQDGGDWDLAVALVEEYGLVPQSVFPESWNSSNSETLDALLTTKLREMGVELRAQMVRHAGQGSKRDAIATAREVKKVMLKEIFRILTICCGTPPKPDQPVRDFRRSLSDLAAVIDVSSDFRAQFVWEFKTTDGQVKSITTTPREFAQVHAGYNCSDTISIIHDPRSPYMHAYCPEWLGNVVGGRKVKYLNLPLDVMKKTAIKMLKADYPIWFGSDVDASSNPDEGYMDVRLYHYDACFGTSLNMNKADRLRTQDSSNTHAMMFTAVHLDGNGNPVRWRVENSWGEEACNKGFLVMTDDWFSEYVFQIVAPRRFVPAEALDAYDHGPVTKVPFWDPFGN
ncbi:hypothetical protein Rhopal_001802-T1 [Rhodotorula paludigena]|uniref:Cysteine proteinase 1, mitochondrial n=1 Tax=Rhodotorula paludigena TaxID=86838 RepID=A0AAV5G8D3_9BASI|nr:hypothetical protein Rhopal_001802-T1 [Rhodotorula paludigena]